MQELQEHSFIQKISSPMSLLQIPTMKVKSNFICREKGDRNLLGAKLFKNQWTMKSVHTKVSNIKYRF